ncbi:MAG: cysteine desulfurase NifS [Candidatus Bathyarchaeota archaeon]|nr:cysteine desulfurase NifS [Candidatus Bathyarchaeota archaeon]MDH5702132.1 cysteine desulfurase NifS [Candidatus Bathyarchaeota archaeon]
MDHAAGMPVDPRVFEAMKPYFVENYGNPSSSYSFGASAKNALMESREKVARLIGAEKPEEVIFTSGGTESNNLAIKGVAYRNKDKGNHIIATTIEHISVINICKHLQKQDFEITYIPVDKQGMVDPEKLKDAITDKTILISVMYANGEIGTIQPIREIGKIAHENQIYFHVDAVAAVGKVPINVGEENIDLLSISSNDMYGPKGMGALYIKKGTRIQPVMQGGGQERGLRSGTENIPGIVGMGKAAEIAQEEMETEGRRLSQLRDKLIKGALNKIARSYLNGHPTKRLPNNANLRFSYIEGESLILGLDMLGIQVSSGSACTSKTLEPSHVLLAIGLAHEEAHGSLVFTMGKQNSEEDVKYVLEVLPGVVRRLRAMSPLTPKEMLR